MNPTYIAKNTKELFESAPDDIKKLLVTGEVHTAATTIANIHKIPVGKVTRLANIISFTIIGAIQPENVVRALRDLLELNSEDAFAIAEDLEKSIFEKARVSLLHKGEEDVKTLTFTGARSPDELRKEILDTTKRTSAITNPQSGKPGVGKTSIITPGSRNQLLEQLQILSSIPNDEEVEARLSHIQEQITKIKDEEDNSLHSNIALKSFMFGEKGKTLVTPQQNTATYSTAPTEYNVDPYRELADI